MAACPILMRIRMRMRKGRLMIRLRMCMKAAKVEELWQPAQP